MPGPCGAGVVNTQLTDAIGVSGPALVVRLPKRSKILHESFASGVCFHTACASQRTACGRAISDLGLGTPPLFNAS